MPLEITREYLASQGLSENFPQRFYAKVNKKESCWLWTGGINGWKMGRGGYGSIGSEGGKSTRTIKAHRASWIINRGPIPEGINVLHNCPGGDNPMCVNPDHLWLGTRKQNIADAAVKCHAEKRRHWNSRLKPDQIQDIRDRFSKGEMQISIAQRFGIAGSTVWKIVRRHGWKHL